MVHNAIFIPFYWILCLPVLDLSIAGSINQGTLRGETFLLLRRKGNSFKFCIFLQHPTSIINSPHQAWRGGQRIYRQICGHPSYLQKQKPCWADARSAPWFSHWERHPGSSPEPEEPEGPAAGPNRLCWSLSCSYNICG